ncbi:MAG: C10 family peptidase [Clostridium sp.]|nr:C10 family peptidase [Bacteroides sp.]MCM1197335.1 C10 family peptidase [Clostridium sp.]
MKRILIFTSIMLTFIVACTKNEETIKGQFIKNNSDVIPLNEALLNLESVLTELYPDTKSGYTHRYTPSQILTLGGKQISIGTKSSDNDLIPDTLMYIVNFLEKGGFAVLSANRKLSTDIYCITENGRISSDDFAQAYNFLQIDDTTKYVDFSEESFDDIGSEIVPALMLSSMMTDIKYGKIKTSIETKTPSGTKYGPLLQTKWHQWKPFNKYTKDDKGRECPTGCVATACAQIMLYNRIPAAPTFKDTQCSWSDMEKVCSCTDLNGNYASAFAKEQVACFLYHIGLRKYCYIRYDPDGSNGYADGVKRTLKEYGYSNVDKAVGFGSKKQDLATKRIRAGYPVYLDGCRHLSSKGHAWVLDGEWGNYYHINWGWNGSWDGYYAKHNYFTVGNRDSQDVKDTLATDSDQVKSHNYDWTFRMVTYTK